MSLRPAAQLLVCVAVALGQERDSKRLGSIDFFGYKGLDIQSIQAALPLRAGNPFPGERSKDEWIRLITDDVTKVIGRGPTDVRAVCCDHEQSWTLYIGLPGLSFRPVELNPRPTGRSKLPAGIVRLSDEVGRAEYRAVMKGNSREDRSRGFSLLEDPEARAKQLAFRARVLHDEKVVLTVLQTSFDDEQRAIAADALGYARRSDRQIAALVKASLDPNGEVRNNAVRALIVLIEAGSKIIHKIPAQPYVALLQSGSWEDHNKASFLLEALTRSRDAQLLAQLRRSALDSLIEIARWRSQGHAVPARMILGRIAGIDEKRLAEMDSADQLEAIITSP